MARHGAGGEAERPGARCFGGAGQLSDAEADLEERATASRWSCRCSLRAEAMPDDPTMQAFLYGPLVLAGDLGGEGLTEAHIVGPNLRVGAPGYGAVRLAAGPGCIGSAPFRRSKYPAFHGVGRRPASWIKPPANR